MSHDEPQRSWLYAFDDAYKLTVGGSTTLVGAWLASSATSGLIAIFGIFMLILGIFVILSVPIDEPEGIRA